MSLLTSKKYHFHCFNVSYKMMLTFGGTGRGKKRDTQIEKNIKHCDFKLVLEFKVN